jgi:hypothetical protein
LQIRNGRDRPLFDLIDDFAGTDAAGGGALGVHAGDEQATRLGLHAELGDDGRVEGHDLQSQ